jgi:hypothetical protein
MQEILKLRSQKQLSNNSHRYKLAGGIYFADCPSAEHHMICLNYRACRIEAEPQVVHVDQGFDCKITFVAANFESFKRGLEDEDTFEDDNDE